MNRLMNYLRDMKIARAYLVSAESYEKRGERERALHCLIESQKITIVAINNFASLYFKAKPKK